MIETFFSDIEIAGCNVQVCLRNKVIEAKQNVATESLSFFENDDVYFLGGVDPSRGKERAGDDHILKKNYTFFDWDVRKDEPDMSDEDIKELGRELLPGLLSSIKGLKNWRYIVYTGNGLHIYYFAKEAIEVKDKNAWKMGMKYYVSKLNEMQTGFDEACINIARISRLPGTYNCKDEKKAVEILAFNDVHSDLLHGLETRGQAELKRIADNRKQVVNDNPGDVYDRINNLSIGDVVAKVMVWEFDGRNFRDPGSEKTKACFVPSGENFLVHGGTDHFPPHADGYSPFMFVKEVKQLNNRETFFWFKSNFPQVVSGADVKEAADAPKKSNIGEVFQKLKNSTFTQLQLTDDLDRYKFIIRGAVTRIGAMSYTGKSKMVYFLTHLLLKNGYPGMIFSTEVPSEMVLANLFQIVVPEAKDIWDILEQRVPLPLGIEERYENLGIYDVKSTQNRLEEIEKIVDATVRDAKKGGVEPPAFMVIDFVQMIMPKAFTNSEFHAASRYAQEVQEIAQRYNIAVIDTSQLNSAGMKDENAQYGDIPFRNSKDLYNNADIAIMLKRDRSVEDNNMVFSIRKHKYQKPAELQMQYNYTNGSFRLSDFHSF